MSSENNSDVRCVIQRCLALDRHAVKVYSQFRGAAPNRKVQNFWGRMVKEEGQHVKIWNGMDAMCSRGQIPELFENSATICDELQECLAYCEAAFHKDSPRTLPETIQYALHLEFYLMHPAIAELFLFAQTVDRNGSIIDDYDRHIAGFLSEITGIQELPETHKFPVKIIQKLWSQNKQTAVLSFTDPLTGTLNRRGFFNVAKSLAYLAQRMGSEVAVFMIDADDFKLINDNHGHLIGDEVLKLIGGELHKSRRQSDIVGRYGGEEFVMFLSSQSGENAVALAEKIRVSIQNNTRELVPATVSIGIAFGKLVSEPMHDLLSMVDAADKQLLEAKRAGKNRVNSKWVSAPKV